MKQDKLMKFAILWIAFMLTVIAFRPIFEIQPVQAENKEERKLPARVEPAPISVRFKEPVRIEFKEPI